MRPPDPWREMVYVSAFFLLQVSHQEAELQLCYVPLESSVFGVNGRWHVCQC